MLSTIEQYQYSYIIQYHHHASIYPARGLPLLCNKSNSPRENHTCMFHSTPMMRTSVFWCFMEFRYVSWLALGLCANSCDVTIVCNMMLHCPVVNDFFRFCVVDRTKKANCKPLRTRLFKPDRLIVSSCHFEIVCCYPGTMFSLVLSGKLNNLTFHIIAQPPHRTALVSEPDMRAGKFLPLTPGHYAAAAGEGVPRHGARLQLRLV